MINPTKLSDLHIKILPPGAERVVELLEKNADKVEFLSFVIEKVPLLIIGRHGMIARLPKNDVIQKYSQPVDIINALRDFFQHHDTLYLFINLPNLPVPKHVSDLIDEVACKVATKEEISLKIDDALDRRDHIAFLQWTQELKKLEDKNTSSQFCGS